jgi:chemotaxis protein CheZ
MGTKDMAVQRKRFRIEEMTHGHMTLPVIAEPLPMQENIVAELRAIRDAMSNPQAAGPQPSGAVTSQVSDTKDAQATLDSYRAQIAQCEKLKIELDLIHDAIDRTKREIAALHGKTFDGGEIMIVSGELGAVVDGTEEATQQILDAAEQIDQAAAAMTRVNSPDQQKALCDDISERVMSIFEACNFQDLTGQRIAKVMATMSFIENHINAMMDIWGGVDAMKAHAPVTIDERSEDARLLNGPKSKDAVGHTSQDDIDALFG